MGVLVEILSRESASDFKPEGSDPAGAQALTDSTLFSQRSRLVEARHLGELIQKSTASLAAASAERDPRKPNELPLPRQFKNSACLAAS